MKNIFIYLSLFLLLSACNFQPEGAVESKATPEPEVKLATAKNFTLIDGANASFSLSDYKGKAVVVIFWATWCPYCAKVMPGLEKYYQRYKTKGLEIIAVNIMEDGDPVAHMKSKGFSYRLGLEGDRVAEQWQVTGTPTLFFINRAGEILAQNQISAPNSPVMAQLIEQILE